MDIESNAREYLETLIIRSFLQKFEYKSKGFVMHDFAQSITKKECSTKDSGNWLDSDYTNAWHLFLGCQIETPLHVSVDSARSLLSLSNGL